MKKRITIKAVNELVIAEATKLKKHATANEIKKLNFATLGTQSETRCIYGQITGSCFSDRATELIGQSCEKVFTNKSRSYDFGDERMGEIKGELNGSPKNSVRMDYWSPIEVFIDMPRNHKNGNNERLIAFLRDETKELKLK